MEYPIHNGAVDEAVDHLYAVPLEEFVSERTRLSRELRKRDRSAAAELAKLPKPSAPAWALNRVAREEPDAIGEWLGTADALREASNRASEVGGDTVRGAMAAHRDSTSRLTAVVREVARPGGRELSEPMLRRVGALLQAATADEEVAELLRAGRITEEAPDDEAGDDAEEIVWTAAPAPKQKQKPRAKSGPKSRPKRAEPDEPEEPEEDPRAARLAELERLEGETEEEATRLRAAAEEAGERAEDAKKALKRAQSEADAAKGAAGDAKDAAAAAERELKQIRQRLRRARG
jgi:hypothetical protein